MAIVIEANYSKKLGLPAYSSHSYSVTIRSEVADLSQVERESAKLYAILQGSVDREIQEVGFIPLAAGNGSTVPRPTNGHSSHPDGEAWNCSDKQRELILKIVDEHLLDKQEVEGLAKDMFQKPVKTLNKLEASGLIEELLEKFGPKKTNGNGRSDQRGESTVIAEILANGIDQKVRLEVLTEEVSASRLGLWSSCRLKFYFRYVAQIEKSPTPALHAGKTVHAVLQAWNLARWRGQVRALADLRDLFIQSWDEDQLGQDIDWAGQEPEQKEGAWRLLETYFQLTPVPPPEKPQGVEVRLEADLVKHGLPNLIGIIDLVRAGGCIVDFKTTAQTPQPDRVAHQTEIQLTCYAVLYREATGDKESGFELHHLVKRKVPKLVVTSLPAATESQQSRLFHQIESYQEGVRREDFVPSPGLQCLSCQYFNECRRWS